MREQIVNYIRTLKPAVILEKKELECGFNIFLVDFIGKDSLFYSILFVYNRVIFFQISRESGLFPLSPCVSFLDNTIVAETKEVWTRKKWTLNPIKKQIKRLSEILYSLTFEKAPSCSGFIQVQVFFQPSLATALIYEKDGILQSKIFNIGKLQNDSIRFLEMRCLDE